MFRGKIQVHLPETSALEGVCTVKGQGLGLPFQRQDFIITA